MKIIRVIILVLLFIMSIEDIKELKIKNSYLIMLAGVSIISCFMEWREGLFFLDQFILGISSGLFILTISILTKEQIGKGDAFVVLALGVACAKTIWSMLSVAFFSLFCVSVYLCIKRKKDKKYELPFVPAITLGYLIQGIVSTIQSLQVPVR